MVDVREQRTILRFSISPTTLAKIGVVSVSHMKWECINGNIYVDLDTVVDDLNGNFQTDGVVSRVNSIIIIINISIMSNDVEKTSSTQRAIQMLEQPGSYASRVEQVMAVRMVGSAHKFAVDDTVLADRTLGFGGGSSNHSRSSTSRDDDEVTGILIRASDDTRRSNINHGFMLRSS
jgi:hypothetical protein